MASKRRKLNLKEKIKILDELKAGEKIATISKRRNIHEATIRTIRRNETTIRKVVAAASTGCFLSGKKMPSRTYVAKQEKSVKGFKVAKERITLLLCSNASGDKMLKPLLVNKNLNPRALKGIDKTKLPVHWMANKNPWVTASLFKDLFLNHFVPEVREYLRSKQLVFKVLLVIDNTPGHPDISHKNVKIMFLPPNTTSLIQPLDQGIIATFKRYYVKNSFQHIINEIETNNEMNVISAWKTFDLKNCIDCISCSVREITKTTLNRCWKNLWADVAVMDTENETLSEYADIFQVSHAIGGEGFHDITIEDINELFENVVISDDEILQNFAENDCNDNKEIDEDSTFKRCWS
ncbi:tigger transposable element-derived protein 1-like [Zeugodacus cucurbitae]|uniref:tigger transposable element-derived protein 1-like n=1 Tax=Zeugodacus cucurbitae TaxID=28588 RepID=UPI0023D951B2|nr:tigger transposable element-derived protein 1-like [Zeugodacus cucurbitae]